MAGSWAVPLANPNTSTADGAVVAGTAFDCPGGICVFSAVASAFNAATVALQMLLPDGQTWINVGATTTLTANGTGLAYLPPCQIRVNVSGGTPTGLFAAIARVVG